MNQNSNQTSSAWLVRLWQKNRFLCGIVLLFFCGTIGANLIQLETTPFFIWNMYKDPVRDSSDYTFYLIRYNESGILNFDKTWKEPQKIYLTSPLFYYMEYQQTGKESSEQYLRENWAVKHPAFKWFLPYLNNSEEQFAAFPGWYKKYLSSVLHKDIYQVDLIKKQIRFREDMSLESIACDTIHLIH